MTKKILRHDVGPCNVFGHHAGPAFSHNPEALLFEREDRLSCQKSTVRSRVLKLDVTGVPQTWITAEEAASYVVTDCVAWYAGDGPLTTLRGGINSLTGRVSVLDIPSILAVKGKSRLNNHNCAPNLTNSKLFKRDRLMCAYCMKTCSLSEATRDHIKPQCLGGPDEWMNVTTACRSCNTLKANKLLSHLGWTLAYTPYVPSLYEDLLLRGRLIRADVHEWLSAKLPKHSRIN